MAFKKLWSLAARRSHSRFESLLEPYVDDLYRTAYRFCGNRDDAQDLVQDLLIKIYDRTDELAALDNPKAWLTRVLYRLYVDRLRKAGRSALGHADGEETVLVNIHDEARGPEEQTDVSARHRRLAEALDQLNADQRALVTLHDVEGYTLTELETILDAPLGTLKSRLNRARTKLRHALEMEPSEGLERVSGVQR